MEYVEVARATSARGDVVIRQRRESDSPEAPGVLELRVNGVFVMDTLECNTEIALARAALEQCTSPRRVLVGGLGLGFTTHEVLADTRVEQLVVAEIEEALVGWFRDGTIAHGRPYLADHRLRIAQAPVQQVIAEATPASYDLVLLDVDNGPDFLVHQDNAELYESEFLREAHRVLRPGGALSVWSSTPAPQLETALREVFGDCGVTELPVLLQGRDESYWLLSAHR